MSKVFYRTVLVFLALLMVLSAFGCRAPQLSAPGSQNAAAASHMPAASEDAPEPSSQETDSGQPAPSDASEPAVECDWTLEVSDTQTAKVNGYDFTCTLTVMAVKLGGTDALGLYSGIATIKYAYDMKSGNVSGEAEGSGQVTIELYTVAPGVYFSGLITGTPV